MTRGGRPSRGRYMPTASTGAAEHRRRAPSVAAERLLEPPGRCRALDLRIDQQGRRPGPADPGGHRPQVLPAPDGDGLEPEAASDGREVRLRETDGVLRRAVRAEVM